MKCEKCGGNLKVTNTYEIPHGAVHRRECLVCQIVFVTETAVLAVNPAWGHGASAIAVQRKKEPR
jgi:hypothetical protein